ncbi:MAG: CehA/McbA family metallohydrolase [Armatimonadota bacterium]|nr:CehA/McbA family metallohydrolase [Armatimonadota bacterium]
MQYINPFQSPGQWFRGNTHTHSTVSDGRLTVPERFAAYRDAGYHFLVLTDHGRVSDVSAYNDDGFLAISGTELHPANPYGGDTYHFVAIDVHEPIPVAGRHPNEVIEEVRARGGHVVLCHPYWCGHTLYDLMPIEGCFAVEVYNDTCAGIGKSTSETHWDDLLDWKGPLLGIACDDAHGAEHDCFHGWVMVKATDLSRESILNALVTGSFYSTMGPALHDVALVSTKEVRDGVEVERRKVVVRSSPVRSIVFKAQRSRGRRHLAPEGGFLEQAEFTLNGSEKYVRVELTDEFGRKAWSNPIFLQ